jgi:hypothetical protein
VTGNGGVSRRDFLRLRRTERGKLVEVSCRTMFMRCADAAIVTEPVDDWQPWMGEPPAVIRRRSVDDLVQSFEQDISDAQVLRLLEPEWLENIACASRISTAIGEFRRRGGIVETPATTEDGS